LFWTTFLQYRLPARRHKIRVRRPAEQSDIDEARQLCRQIAEVATEARWTHDPRAIELALRLLAKRLHRVAELAETMGQCDAR
jgi:hypothetical protein